MTIELTDSVNRPIYFRVEGIIGVRHVVEGESGVAAIITSFGPFFVLEPVDEIAELLKDD